MKKPRDYTKTTLSLAPLTVDDVLGAMLHTPPPPVMSASARAGLERLKKREPKNKKAPTKKRKRR